MSDPEYYLNPPEEAHCPPCSECGEELWQAENQYGYKMREFECRNPDCPECAKKYQKATE